jgi:Aminoglycoside-2''-adenylyltransferase
MTTRRETDRVPAAEQLAALARIHELLDGQGIEYWLFGGWAVDFHAGSVTRTHDDLDIAVWLKDHKRIAALLAADGWRHAPEGHEDGYTRYERGALRLELAFLAASEEGHVYTPLREGRAAWPDEAFEDDVAELAGVRARVISLPALKADKAERRDDPIVAAKDRADLATLSTLS